MSRDVPYIVLLIVSGLSWVLGQLVNDLGKTPVLQYQWKNDNENRQVLAIANISRTDEIRLENLDIDGNAQVQPVNGVCGVVNFVPPYKVAAARPSIVSFDKSTCRLPLALGSTVTLAPGASFEILMRFSGGELQPFLVNKTEANTKVRFMPSSSIEAVLIRHYVSLLVVILGGGAVLVIVLLTADCFWGQRKKT